VSAVIETIAGKRLLPVVVLRDAEAAAPLGEALQAGGLRCVEITYRTDAAEKAIRTLSRDPRLLVGAGTVLSPEQVESAVTAGARFVVSPGFSPAVVRRCQQLGVPVIPGVATATEIQMALEVGVRAVKVFPAEQLGGAAMVKALSAPFPAVRFVPTGGVTRESLSGYLALPRVLAVGGTWMVTADLIERGDWQQITRLTAEAVAAVTAGGGGHGVA
jgi:2-dehydro-3-deoxyphosphogluconate aldolase/(4S)-4-hydroxy-2-oxoglutarate aldolase